MINIETKEWKLRADDSKFVDVIKRATGEARTVLRSQLPSVADLWMMHEKTFNKVCSKLFDNARETNERWI